MLVAIMAAVGFYYERQAGLSSHAEDGALLGTAIKAGEGPPETRLSGVDLEALDRETAPQDDFYQFANGGWLDTTKIPEIYSGYTVYHEVNERTEAALRKIVEAAAANPGQPGTESQQVGDLYRSWMDEDAINAAGIAPVAPDLERVASIDSVDDLVRVMAELSRAGVMVPYETTVDPALKDSARYTVYFFQSGITMPNRDYYIELDNPNFAEAREKLPTYIARLLVRSGMKEGEAGEASRAVYELESAIAQAQWDSVSNRDPDKIYNPYPVNELEALGGNIDWQATREILGVQGEEKLIIEQPSYFESLDRLVAEVPLETWKNYLRFRVLDRTAPHLDESTARIRFDYRNRVLNGQQEERPRWKRGISIVDGLVGESVGKLYVARYFPPAAKQKMEVLVENVIATLDESLQNLDWMSEDTRIRAREKLSRFTAKIGYPDEWKDYSALNIVAGDHIGNLRRATAWEYQRNLDKLGTPVDKKEWYMTPQTVNAYYSPTKNEIVFPAARLQPPFFQLNADDAINYGAVGGVIGHEISHGFDDKGSKFDGDGNLNNWWTDADRKAFEKRTAALVAQYDAFEPVEGMHINGELTLGENIGDLSGIAMAYRAYIRSLGGAE
ncbi:MAG: M13 family metallopeptidase, partial [Planctomycetes bacterium]|nr:M13 family metallopeptidase [Planctomycetota bacterium]